MRHREDSLRLRYVDFKEGHPPRVCTIFEEPLSPKSSSRCKGEDVHVAHNVFTQPCLDPIDDVLFIYVP